MTSWEPGLLQWRAGQIPGHERLKPMPMAQAAVLKVSFFFRAGDADLDMTQPTPGHQADALCGHAM